MSIPYSVRIKKGGKAEYVRWQPPPIDGRKRDPVDLCVCLYNVDFSQGCIAHVKNERVDEVVANNGRYASIAAVREQNGGKSAFGCDYCYARFQGIGNARPVTPLRITQDTVDDMLLLVQERPEPLDRIIRLGKKTEVGHPYYRGTLLQFMQLVQQYRARVIMPTKMLEYDKTLADLLKATKSSVNFSIVGDFLEEGPVSQGFTQKWRIDQAEKYLAAGVRTSVTLTCDISASIEHNQKLGYAVREALEAHDQRSIPLRLLPMRIPSKEIALKATGRTWDELLTRDQFFPFAHDSSEGIHFRHGSHVKGPFLEVSPEGMHDDFRKLYDILNGQDRGACGKAGGKEHCDKCGLQNANGDVPLYRFPVEQLMPPKQAVPLNLPQKVSPKQQGFEFIVEE